MISKRDYNTFWEQVDSGSEMIKILPIFIIFARNDSAPLKMKFPKRRYSQEKFDSETESHFYQMKV